MRLLCLTLFLLVATCQSTTTKGDFGLGIPSSLIQNIFNGVILPAVDDVINAAGQQLPPQCCYKKIGTKLQLTNISMPTDSIHSLATVVSDSNGLQFDLNLGFDLDMNLKLCEEIVRSCDTLFGCNNQAVLDFEMTSKILIIVSVNSSGQLVLYAPNATLQINIPSFGNLCAFVKGIILETLASVNADLNSLFPEIVNGLLDAISNTLNSPIDIGEVMSLHLVFNPDATGTSTPGIGLSGDITVVSLKTGKTSPFVPSSPIPNILTVMGATEEEGIGSDALINNIIYAIYSDVPHHYDVPVYLQGNEFQFHIDIRKSPEVNFSSTTGSSLIIWTRNTVQNGIVHITFDMRTQIYFALKMEEGGVYLQLSPDDFLFDITVIPPINIDNFTGTIDDLVEALYREYIPKLNVLLMDTPFKLPSVPYFNSPDIVVDDGFAIATLQNGHPKDDDVYTLLIQNEMDGLLMRVGSMFIEQLATEISKNFSKDNHPTENEDALKVARNFHCPPVPDFSYDTCS